ncbi:stAR-related lipid transfer protein 4 isoform X7 [Bubalus kerabau]|uniref:stAR-related lipid transfer protein 4 isoform X7 n=1 Tax=Bubalus carabanensis TaxID=3119969 RepID=UPI00244E7C5A|nr:stAR-related lipid transfer protein 4 isoform X7 [Bubalus carabanensis]
MEALPDTAVLATRLKNTLIQYHNLEDEKWRVAKKTKDVTIWRKPSEEFNGYLFKAQGVIGDAANSVIDHIRPGPCRLDWDSLMTSLDILEHFEEKQTCSNFLRSKWDEEPCAKEKKSGVRESVPSCYQKEACKIPLRVYVQPFVNEETCSPTVDFGL